MKLLILLALAFTIKAEAKLLNKVLADVENESITLLEAKGREIHIKIKKQLALKFIIKKNLTLS